jgi:transcriptional regulator with XRE-family HTH domain
MALHELLKQAFDDAGMSSLDISRETGLNGRTIRDYRAGNRRPSPDDFQTMVDALKPTPDLRLALNAAYSGTTADALAKLARRKRRTASA